jgi:hypothetical protein
MQTLSAALWRGLVNGASTPQRASAPTPQGLGFGGSIAQALYWFGFQVANVVVYGSRK